MATAQILVVEDEAIVAEDIASYLTEMSYSVVDIVASGEHAISAASRSQPDLILMDIMLQGRMDGVEAAQRIHTELNIPIVYLTANADDKTLQRATESSPFGYVLKPFKQKELRAAIAIALSRHQAEVRIQKALAASEDRCQKAEASSANKSRYFSMAAHQLHRPLSEIQGSAQALHQETASSYTEWQRQHIQTIREATESMRHLLDDALVLGQVDCDRLKLAPASVEMVSLCQQIVNTFQQTIGDRPLLHLQTSSELLYATLDQTLICYLLNSLLSNAVKYSPKESLVTLKLDRDDNHLQLQVCDTGIGIPSAEQAKLFQPFQRASNVGQIRGSGLGLAIAQRVVDLHQGTISCQSQPGQGTTFTVTLPLETAIAHN